MAKLGFGAKFAISTAAITIADEVAEILSVKPPSSTTETQDATHHGSAGGVREFIAGLIDPGELSLPLQWDAGSDSDTRLETAANSRTKHNFRVTVPAPTGTRIATGVCIPTGFDKDPVEIDGKMTATFTAKVSGPVTWAAGA